MKRAFVVGFAMLMAAAAPAAVKIQGNAFDYVQITNAVANAVSGHTILISTGVYNEAVDIAGKNLVLDGGWNHDCSLKVAGGQSVIDADSPVLLGGWGSALDITGSEVLLRNLDLRGGEWSLGVASGYGGGLDVRSGSIVTAVECRVYNNYALGKGGGVYVYEASLHLIDTPVYSNMAYWTGLTVPANIYGWGGGICVEDGFLTLEGASAVYTNWAQAFGGGLYGKGSRLLLRGASVDVQYNSASNGGGIALSGGFLDFSGNADMMENVATNSGGGIYLMNGATGNVHGAGTYVGFSSKEPNRALFSGGGVYADQSVLIISNSASVAHNIGAVAGGGVFLVGSTCRVESATVGLPGQTNQAWYGGGLAANDSLVELRRNASVSAGRAPFGGGVFASNSTVIVHSTAVLGHTNNLDWGNMAWYGGGLLAYDSSIYLYGRVENNQAVFGLGGGLGGGLLLDDSYLYATGAVLRGNIAQTSYGGGLAMYGGTGLFANVQIASNSAVNGGGAAFIDVRGFTMESFCLVQSNSAAQDGGGLYYASSNTLWLRDAIVQRNQATRHGGGLCAASGTVSCWNGEIRENIAGGDGGGVYASNAVLDVFAVGAGGLIYGNQAERGGGLAVDRGATALLTGEGDLFVTGNRAGADGGGVWIDGGVALANGRLYIGGNVATNKGGGLYIARNPLFNMGPRVSGRPYIYNNRAGRSGGGLCVDSNAVAALAGVRIGYSSEVNDSPNYARGTNSFEGGGGAAVLNGARLYLTNTWVNYNVSSNMGGGVYAYRSRLGVKGNYATMAPGDFLPPNRVMYNRAAQGSGGGIGGFQSTMGIQDALVFSNLAERGGGVMLDTATTGTLVNVVVADNTASITGAGVRVYSSQSKAELLHCVLGFNWGDGLAGDPASWVEVTYGIAWGNSFAQITPGHVVTYSDVMGGYLGVGNLNVFPSFRNWPQADYRLLYGSPCIDQALGGSLAINDCIGQARPVGAFADLGAYEYNRDTYDSDNDTIPDGWEADNGMNPLSGLDALVDSDTDTYLNIQEYVSDTNPFDDTDYLRIVTVAEAAGTRQVGFPSSTGRVYALYATPYMTNDASWAVVGTNVNLRGNGARYVAADTNAPMGHAFYRVDVRLP